MVTVLSGSMAPAYPTDSVLAVEPVPATDVRAGDVIAYRVDPDTPMVTHRVIEVRTGPVFVTKGDANEDPDAKPVAAADLRGPGGARRPRTRRIHPGRAPAGRLRPAAGRARTAGRRPAVPGTPQAAGPAVSTVSRWKHPRPAGATAGGQAGRPWEHIRS
jgi:hypothetical protein